MTPTTCCRTCRFGRPRSDQDEKFRECRRHAPSADMTWPQVRHEAWCGDYQPHAPAADPGAVYWMQSAPAPGGVYQLLTDADLRVRDQAVARRERETAISALRHLTTDPLLLGAFEAALRQWGRR